MLFRLPEYETPYRLRIRTFRRGLGYTTEVFVPIGVYFDAEFEQTGLLAEDKFRGAEERLEADV